MLYLELLLKEFGQFHLSNETEALAVFFLCGGELCFCSNAPDLRLFQFTNGEQRVGKLFGSDLTQKVALVFIGVSPCQQLVPPLGRRGAPAIVASCHGICTQLMGGIAKEVEFDFAVAQHVGVGRSARCVLGKHVVYNPLAVSIRKVDDLERDAQMLGHKEGVVGIVHPRTGVVKGDGVVDPIAHKNADDIVALSLQLQRGHAAVHTT